MKRHPAQALSALAVMYERHGSPERALVLGLSAMKLSDEPDPGLWLSMASAFLATESAENTLAIIHRFEGGGPFNDVELHAAYRLKTRAHLALGQRPEARAAAAMANRYAPPPASANRDDPAALATGQPRSGGQS